MAKQVTGQSTKAIDEWALAVSKVTREIQKMNAEGKSAAEIQKKLGKEMKNLKEQANRLTVASKNYYKQTTDIDKANANLKKRLDKLNAGVVKLTQNENKLTSTTQVATKGFGKFAAGVKSAIGTLSRFATAGALIGAAVKAFQFVIVDSVKAFVAFDDAVKNLSAVAGVAGRDLVKLQEAALDTAGATRFTALEVVKLQTELSKLGFSATQVAQATAPIAFTAQALGSTMEETALQVGKLINQFGLLAVDAQFVGDVLVTTINNSALSLGSFATAMQYIGPIASDFGLDLQQTAGAMAVLADNGFTASRIGTGLRAIFTKLGVTTVDLESKLQELAEANISVADAAELVGVRNASQLITLLGNIDAIDTANGKYYELGRALQAAATQTTSVSGQLDILKSEINRTQISIGRFIANTELLAQAIGLVSTSARDTIESFKALNRMSSDELRDDLTLLSEGASAAEVALQRLATQAGMTAEEYVKQMNSQARATNTFQRALLQQLPVFGQVLAFLNDLRGAQGESASAVRGLTDSYQQQIDAIELQLIAENERLKVNSQYETTLNDLIIQEAEGVDVTEQAAAMADEVKDKRLAAMKQMQSYAKELENNKDLTDEERKSLEKSRLQYEAQGKALLQYERRFANFIKTYADAGDNEREQVDRRRAENFRKLIDTFEDAEAKEKRAFEIRKLANETNEDYLATNDAIATSIFQLQSLNASAIFQLEEEKAARQALIEQEEKNLDSQGNLTKQAQANINTYLTEIGTLDNLIMKYEDKNVALEANAGTLRTYASNFEKAQKALLEASSDEDGVIINQEEYVEASNKLIGQYISQLEVAAENNPDLKRAIDALLNRVSTELGEPGREIPWGEILKEGIEEATEAVAKSLDSFNDEAFGNLKRRLEAEKEALRARYETEDFLAKAQYENGLINEAQFRRRQQQLRKNQIAEENAIDKKIFDAQKKRDKNSAKVDYLEALASIIPNLIITDKEADPVTIAIKSAITAAIATASFGAEMAAINSRKFFPKKFEQGGMVQGPSHQNGGVPFTVQGQGGYEMEGGEFIVNKRAASLHRDLLEKINSSIKPVSAPAPMKFAQGGNVSSSVTNINQQSQESVNYLKAIAEATTTNAINSSKPVRAFVTSTDLRRDESARRIKDNNTTI